MGILADIFHRDAHPTWFVMCVLLWLLATLIIWGALAEGAATTKTNEIAVGGTSQSDVFQGYQNAAARGPDNIIRHAYRTTDNDVNLSYSSNNGTDWTEVEVLAGSYAGLTDVDVWGVVVSSNNTTAVLVQTTDAEHKYDLYLIVLWAFRLDWSWTRYTIHYHASAAWSYVDLAINDTNVVCIVGLFNGNNVYKTFRMSDKVITPSGAPTVWVGASTYPISVVAKSTGKFWVCWQSWDGSNYRQNYRDFCQTVATVYLAVTSWNSYMGGVVCTQDDTLVCAWGSNQAANYYVRLVYLLNGYTTVIQRAVIPSTATVIKFQTVTLAQDGGNNVYVAWYDDTNDKTKMLGGKYYLDQVEWGAKTPWIIASDSGASDSTICNQGLASLWPRVLGTPTGVPKTGFFLGYDWQDEKGANDDYYKRVVWDSTNVTWPHISWLPLGIANLTSEDAEIGDWYLHDFNATNGNTPFVWWAVWVTGADGGWFQIDGNGTMYGYAPASVGEYQLTIHVSDFYGIHKSAAFFVNVTDPAPTVVYVNTTVYRDRPGLNENPILLPGSFQGQLWLVLVVVAVVAGVIQTIRRHMDNVDARMDKTIWEKLR